MLCSEEELEIGDDASGIMQLPGDLEPGTPLEEACLLYTSDAADDLLCVDLGGRRIIQKKNHNTI